MQRYADKMLGPWDTNWQAGFEASELLQEVETGDVGTREVSEAQGQCLQGWSRDLGVRGLSSRTCQHGGLGK